LAFGNYGESAIAFHNRFAFLRIGKINKWLINPQAAPPESPVAFSRGRRKGDVDGCACVQTTPKERETESLFD
jgi:hypothetical protein